jgi:hypothetical protein
MIFKKIRLNNNVCTALVLSLVLSAPSAAVIPPRLVPNDEEVCKILKDATSGLYGLCLAYCESTDSSELLMTEVDRAALPAFRIKLFAKYNGKRQAGDPQMPCATYYNDTGCPAWTKDQINSVGSRVSSASEAESTQIRLDNKQHNRDNKFSSIYDREYLHHDGVRIENNMVHVYISSGHKFGRFFDFSYDWDTSTWKREVYNKVQLGPVEYDACVAEIRAHHMPTQTRTNSI